MIPRIGKQGRSFKGAAAYYLHDKNATTSNRVTFTHTENLPTDQAERAFDWMAYTAMDAEDLKRQAGVKRGGAPSEKPVLALSFSWHPEQENELTQEHMIDTANSALAALGLQEHQAVMIGHNDEAHPHVHAIVNLVHPETGRTAPLKFSKEKLSKWAEQYEREHGKIYCEQRVDNNEKRDHAKESDIEEYPRYEDPEKDHKALVSHLYHASDSGKAFQAALAEHGFKLAQGKRIVIVGPDGKAHSIARWIEGAKEKDLRAKFSDITLVSIEDIEGQRQQDGRKEEQSEPRRGEAHSVKEERVYFDRDAQDRAWMESVIDASIEEADRKKPKRRKQQKPSKESTPEDESRRINEIQNRHFAELGRFYSENAEAKTRLEEEIEAAYGNDERRLRAEIDAGESRLKNAGRFRRAIMVLTGSWTRSRRKIEEKALSLQNIEWRKKERTEALEKQIESNRTRLLARHEQERAQVRPHDDIPRPSPAPDFRAAHGAFDDEAAYQMRRAAFFTREAADYVLPVPQAPAPSPDPPALAAHFAAAAQGADAGYEARRSAFMEGPGVGGGESPSAAPSHDFGDFGSANA